MDATVAGWTLVVAGLVSSLTAAVILSVGAILTGNDLVTATGAATVAVGGSALLLVVAALRRPGTVAAAARLVSRLARYLSRVLRRPVRDPVAVLAGMTTGLGTLRLSPQGWVAVIGAAFVNWLADAGVLAVSLLAVGSPVPWRGLLFAYAVGTAAASVGLTPGGIGVVESALALTLVGVGVPHRLAFAAVLVYRLVSYWVVVSVGWLTYLVITRPSRFPSAEPVAP